MQKSITRKVAEGTAYFSSGTILLKLISLATVFVILRQLSLYEYGLFELALTAVSIVGIFQLPGLADSVTADMARLRSNGAPGDAKRIFINFYKVQTALSLVAALILYIGSSIIAKYYKGDISVLLKLLSLSMFILPFRSAVQILLAVELKYLYQSAYAILEELSKLLLIMVFFYRYEMGVEAIPLSMIFSQLITICIFFTVARRISVSYGHASPITGSWRQIFKYHGIWNVGTTYVSNYGQALRVAFVRLFLGTEAVAIYSVAQGLYGHTVSLIPVAKVIAPLIPQYVNDPTLIGRIVTKAVKYQLAMYAVLGAVAAVAFPPLLVIIFPKYTGAMMLYQLMLFSLIPNSAASILSSLYIAYRAQRSLFVATVVKCVFILIMAPLSLYFFGIRGMAIELFVVTALFTGERYRKISNMVPELRLNLRQMTHVDEYDRMITTRLIGVMRDKYAKFTSR